MKYTLILAITFFLLSPPLSMTAQQLITPFGGFLESGKGSLSFSLGEVVITTIDGREGVLTQGFQQPDPILELKQGFRIDWYNGLILDDDAGNGRFIIKGLSSYPDNKLFILNRWGEVLYQAESYQNDWNGYVNGQPLPQATYFFILYPEKNNKKAVRGNLYILENN